MGPNVRELRKIGNWLINGDVGSSSKAMCAVFMDSDAFNQLSYPSDPADFHRCVLFLENCVDPSKRQSLIFEMGTKNVQWAAISKNWKTLKDLYIEEVKSGNCPKLFKKLKDLIK